MASLSFYFLYITFWHQQHLQVHRNVSSALIFCGWCKITGRQIRGSLLFQNVQGSFEIITLFLASYPALVDFSIDGMLMWVSLRGLHGGLGVASQLEGSWVRSQFYSVLPTHVLVFSGYFLLPSKSMHVRLTGDSKLTLIFFDIFRCAGKTLTLVYILRWLMLWRTI